MATGIYDLLDSGGGRKLEKFGEVVLERPCAQAVWSAQQDPERWKPNGAFIRTGSEGKWQLRQSVPAEWTCEVDGLSFLLRATDFGHVGVFPEHRRAWRWVTDTIQSQPGRTLKVLNLFAYSGGATLAAARAGATVVHLDASKKMVQWARDNAALNKLSDRPIRWICDDVTKFLDRELRRGNRYDAILLDPPSFGRGKRLELFKIDTHLSKLLSQCQALLSDQPACLFLSCHTPGYTPLVLDHLVRQMMGSQGRIETGEMQLTGTDALAIPSGAYAAWRA
ncbi:MAG TPA: hypothetical protein DCR55_03245 [Lentisphaeria bacterium]|mgnify:FL=1|jgi:23S rRNA (cytosine1962-C5)-methyltransferase|nr:hypothetical protein [Lentisphaeria bacterium]